jgi:hypothetical protein
MKAGPPLFWLAVSLWVGGLASLAIAAPVIFKTAPSRETAGLIFGSILRAFSKAEFIFAVLAVLGMNLAWNGRSTVNLVRAGLLGLMIVVLVVLHAWLVPTMETIRPGIAGNPEAHQRFQSLHKLSETLYKVNVFAGVALIVLSAWPVRRAEG